jgi:6-phosphogluconolactonase
MNASMSYKAWVVGVAGVVLAFGCDSSEPDGDGGEAGSGGGKGGTGGSSAGTAGQGEAGQAVGGEGGAGLGGEGGVGGAPDEAPVVAYISTLLGTLYMASVDPTSGAPELLPEPPDIDGFVNGVVVSPNGKFAFVPADPPRVETFPIGADGSLPAEPSSTVELDDEEANLLSLSLDPQGRFAYGVLPFEQSIQVFKLNQQTGVLTLSGDPVPIGEEPNLRSPAFAAPDPSGRFVYVTQQAGGPFGIRGYSVNQTTGALTELAASPFEEGDVISGIATFTPDGKFMYTSGNGLNGFAVDQDTGELTLLEGSPFSDDVSTDPWAPNLAMDPQGKFLVASDFLQTRHITGFKIDAATGALEQAAGDPVTSPAPYSIGLSPGGKFVYVGDDNGQTSVFKVNRASAQLTKVEGSPFEFGGLEADIAFVTLP